MSKERRRLTIPAKPLLVRETLQLICPAIIAADDRPPLLSYSDDNFMAAFLSLANRNQPVENKDLPPLLCWRDWSEPPQAMINAKGQAAYPIAKIKRGLLLGLQLEETSSDSDPLNPDPLNSDPIPAPASTLDPPWLRKLYLPQHARFTVVCVDAICNRYGKPSLDRRRVKQAGMIVRRLKPGLVGEEEHWEDWFPSGEGEGWWQERYDAELHPIGGGGARAIGLDPVEAGLQSHTLRLIPEATDPQQPTPCRLYGYLPVWSAERQRPPEAAEGSATSQLPTQDTITQQRLEELEPIWGELGAKAVNVLALLRLTLLPARTVPQSREEATETPSNTIVVEALKRLAKAGLDSTHFTKDLGGRCPDGTTLWGELWFDAVGTELEPWLPTSKLLDSARPDQEPVSDLDGLLRKRVHETVELHVKHPSRSILSSRQWSLLLAAALVRARGHLLALARAIELKQAATQPGFSLSTEDDWLATLPGLPAAGDRPVRPGAAVYSLGALLDWLALYRQKDRRLLVANQRLTFSTANQGGRLEEVLDHLLALRDALAPVARQLGAAGFSVRAALAEQGRALESDLLQAVDINSTTTDLANLGVPLDEAPAEGLLVAPGLHPTGADLATLRSRSKALDGDSSRFGKAAKLSSEASTELRYDSDHLYAVWCWVRVGGRSPCEREQMIWSKRTEPFRIAEPHDLLGVRPVCIPMPDLPRLLKDMGRILQARAKPYASVRTPPQSGFEAKNLTSISRRMGSGGSCSFGIPVFTICALVMFSIVFAILSLVLRWLPLLKICTPTVDESSSP